MVKVYNTKQTELFYTSMEYPEIGVIWSCADWPTRAEMQGL